MKPRLVINNDVPAAATESEKVEFTFSFSKDGVRASLNGEMINPGIGMIALRDRIKSHLDQGLPVLHPDRAASMGLL